MSSRRLQTQCFTAQLSGRNPSPTVEICEIHPARSDISDLGTRRPGQKLLWKRSEEVYVALVARCPELRATVRMMGLSCRHTGALVRLRILDEKPAFRP